MMRRIFIATCVSLAMSVPALAQEAPDRPRTTVQTDIQAAAKPLVRSVEDGRDCVGRDPCATPNSAERTRMALALMFLGIKSNCGQQNCGLRVATIRQ